MLAPDITERRLREIRRRTHLYKRLREHASIWIFAACLCILAAALIFSGDSPASRAIIAIAVLAAASAFTFACIRIQRQKRSNQR